MPLTLSLGGELLTNYDKYQGCLALNIKCRKPLTLSLETQAKLQVLDAAVRENVESNAVEALRESWWATIDMRAQELALGKLSSGGRSGGWLCFDTKVEDFEELLHRAEEHCAACERSFAQHVNLKCLFEASWFQFTEEGDTTAHKFFALHVFAEEVTASLQTDGEGYEEEVLFQLQHLEEA